MKEINHFIQEKLTVNKNTKVKVGYDPEDVDKLAQKLYQKFGRHYDEFENIKKDHKFHFCVLPDDEDTLKYYKDQIPKEIFDTAEIEESHQGIGEIFYNFDLVNIMDYYYDIDDAYNNVCKWFDYLK